MNNQDDLHDDVDPKLQQLYRQLPKEQPGAELDAKILAAAKMTTPKKPHHWQAPFALAASVVMVSSVVLYLHDENPAAFKATAPATQTPAVEIAKPGIQNLNNVNDITNAKSLTDKANKKTTRQKAKDESIAKPENAKTVNIDVLEDNNLATLAEKKADIANRADQIAKATLAHQSEKSMQASITTKEQETRQEKIDADNFALYAPAPAPMTAPTPQMQPQPEVAEMKSSQADRLQDAKRASRQLSVTRSAESAQPTVSEKSNDVPALAAAPMAPAPAPINAGSLAGAAMPIAKQRIQRDEAASTDYAQNITVPVLSIEGVAMGMSREQLVAQGLMCYVDVCHLDLSQPKQAHYWGIPATNAHLTAFLTHQVVTKLLLQQKNVQSNQVKKALSNIGIASQQSCIEEKGTLLIGRQLGVNYFNVWSMGAGLSLVICQQTKSLNKP